MEIRNLNTFLHAASLQNITRAAAELGYSQSAVSVQIRQLEQELGMPLFDRIGKNVYLTDFGRSLVPYARSAVAAVAAVENFGKSDAVLGGAIGGTLGMYAFRHKTRHWYFALGFPAAALLQIAACVLLKVKL